MDSQPGDRDKPSGSTPPRSRGGPARDAVALLAAVVSLAAWLLLAHSRLDVGWGANLVHRQGRQYAYGIAFNEMDNLSYVAWAQQAAQGHFPFQVLYSTEPHAPLLINPFFLFVGRAAELLSTQPIAVMNLAGFFAALLTVAFVYLACRAMSMTRRGALLAVLLIALGSGLSGLFYVVNLLLGTHLPTDLDPGRPGGFADLIPSLAFQGFPYHTVGFMLLAALLCGAASAERRLLQGRRAGLLLALTALCAVALAATRPYEPIAFAAAYGVYLLMAWPRQKKITLSPSSTPNTSPQSEISNLKSEIPSPSSPHSALRTPHSSFSARLRVFVVILPAMALFILYSYWLSRQPVWASFAGQSLAMRQGRLTWLLLFGLFWPAALLGARLRGCGQSCRLGLPGAWTLLMLVLFVGLDSRYAKLASGGFLSLGILAGNACDCLLARIQRLAPRAIRVAALLAAVLLLFSTTLGTFISFRESPQWVPIVDREMLSLARLAVQQTPGRPPLILTDCWTGSLLPGLTGARVYAGHWSLTVSYPEKLRELSAAGLEWTPLARAIIGPQPVPGAPAQALSDLLARAPFDFVLVPRACPAFAVLRVHPRLRPLRVGEDWTLFAVS